MKVKIEYTRDIVGSNYIAVNIYNDLLTPYLSQLSQILGEEYEQYVNFQKERDHGKHHITVLNVIEYNKLCKEIGMREMVERIEKDLSLEFNIQLLGLGTATKNENTTYFVVVKSDELNEWRKSFGLGEHHFHITLGFKWKDVFGVPKNIVMCIKDPFISKLKDLYMEDETFEFIKKMDEFDSDESLTIEPIKIQDTSITVRCGSDYYTLCEIGNEIRIGAKWQDTKKIPILPNTVIYKKLK